MVDFETIFFLVPVVVIFRFKDRTNHSICPIYCLSNSMTRNIRHLNSMQ